MTFNISMNKPAEKVVTWDQYKNRVSFFRIQSGKVFLNTYERWFDKAEKDFGVPREVIAAIIGLETNYGGYKGKIRVIDALSTAAFDYPRRRSFFKKQLEEFFLLSREENFDITGGLMREQWALLNLCQIIIEDWLWILMRMAKETL